jgi:protoporphyrin/coproporphyrin ferrochelatase
MSTKTVVILANFGGPRGISEIGSFLTELLTDPDVIRTPFPRFFEKWFFTRVAIKRVSKIAKDYELIGGKSPIFEDTEALAEELRKRTNLPVITFHRYLPATHEQFFIELSAAQAEKLKIIPMYPQFSYSTTGSIARYFEQYLKQEVVQKMEWVKSYADHPPYIAAMQNCIREFLQESELEEKETFLFFSAHGLPQKFVDQGDPYQQECNKTYKAVMQAFPETLSLLAFQSKFGRGEWLKPYTSELSVNPSPWIQGRKQVVFVPLSFTSDHLETLYEIEYTYLQDVKDKGLSAYRCPALNRRGDWIDAVVSLIPETKTDNQSLIRK